VVSLKFPVGVNVSFFRVNALIKQTCYCAPCFYTKDQFFLCRRVLFQHTEMYLLRQAAYKLVSRTNHFFLPFFCGIIEQRTDHPADFCNQYNVVAEVALRVLCGLYD
jgi:hypothetical protein